MPDTGGAEVLLQVADEMRMRIEARQAADPELLNSWVQQVEEGTTGLLTIIGQLSQEAVDAAMEAGQAKKESADAKLAHTDAAKKYQEKIEAAKMIIEKFGRHGQRRPSTNS